MNWVINRRFRAVVRRRLISKVHLNLDRRGRMIRFFFTLSTIAFDENKKKNLNRTWKIECSTRTTRSAKTWIGQRDRCLDFIFVHRRMPFDLRTVSRHRCHTQRIERTPLQLQLHFCHCICIVSCSFGRFAAALNTQIFSLSISLNNNNNSRWE